MAATKEGRKIVATVNLTEFDVEIMLKALGAQQHQLQDTHQPSQHISILIEKIYRAMGVRI